MRFHGAFLFRSTANTAVRDRRLSVVGLALSEVLGLPLKRTHRVAWVKGERGATRHFWAWEVGAGCEDDGWCFRQSNTFLICFWLEVRRFRWVLEFESRFVGSFRTCRSFFLKASLFSL